MFKYRSYQKELLDADAIPTQDLYRNLSELNFINTYLGGHDVTIRGIKKMLGKELPKTQISIADVGCGGGDNLIAIAKWARKNKIKADLVGIDLKSDCIGYATENCKEYPEIRFIISDYSLVDQQFDIVFSALFCHHLDQNQLNQYLTWSERSSKIGSFINDLHRHFLAYYSIKFLTAIFSKSYLVKNDAPLSVLRGFTKSELLTAIDKSTQSAVKVQWIWAFRFLVVLKHSS